ncbi:hypothetical protein FLM48_07545 [Shewanella sp. Scap07]|uniref:hypothetical protein n=1 Tax=Shewanella sp. Scap07 TaxID=2589987 RepID=UPI0015C1AC3A|nr:hypothetical protein [Shewanella sp. Scap07]QLE84953.1 hypothetical protein FLM48_07545 [Shewanella sp. Scap07]
MQSQSPLIRRLSLAALLFPLPAFAFQSDTTNTLLLAIGLGGFCIFNLLLIGLFHFTGQYSSRGFAKAHMAISLFVAAAALAIALIYLQGVGAIMLNLGVVIVAVSLALLPMHLVNVDKSKPSWATTALLMAAVLLMLAAYTLTPIALFAIACAHVAALNAKHIAIKIAAHGVALWGYGYIGYWLYQFSQHI